MLAKFLKFLALIMTASKYIFSLCLAFMALSVTQDPFFFLVNILELLFIALTSNLLVSWKKWLGQIYNIIFLFLFNVQLAILFFGGSYLTLNMLANIDSFDALSGNYFVYFTLIIFLVLFTVLPITEINYKSLRLPLSYALSLALFSELIITMVGGTTYSPLYNIADLAIQRHQYLEEQAEIAKQPNMTAAFYRSGVTNSRQKPADLPKHPNVIVLFTEGLSQNVIDDSRKIMPNVQSLQKKSLNFSNYYNHTLATYRGLIGQLYSGYQLNNTDRNTLISVQDILADKGYQTTFINTEPRNIQFTQYLENFDFQTFISDSETDYSGPSQTLSDKEAFEQLWETITTQAKSKQPFFTAMYTFQTHMSLDSKDEKYKDGKNPMLNKFYNFDYQFAAFMKKFEASDLAKNTIIVFTADHATYQDAAFNTTFEDYERENPHVDKMPLFFYYKGIKPEVIKAEGRNSLDMVPTLLDYLDISAPNYFLGEPLFMQKNNNNSYDTVFHDESFILSTDGAKISSLSENNLKTFKLQLKKYFAAKTQNPNEKEDAQKASSSSSDKKSSSSSSTGKSSSSSSRSTTTTKTETKN